MLQVVLEHRGAQVAEIFVEKRGDELQAVARDVLGEKRLKFGGVANESEKMPARVRPSGSSMEQPASA